MKKSLIIALKLGITLLLVAWVFHNLGEEKRAQMFEKIVRAQPQGLLAGFGMLMIIPVLCTWRWNLLLVAQGIHLSVREVMWLSCVGFYFNTFLPGATGGDVLKAWYITQAAPDHKTPGILSIAVDRLIGLFGLFLLATLSVLLGLNSLLSQPETRKIAQVVVAGFVATILGVLLSTQRRQITSTSWWKALWKRMPAQGVFSRLSSSYDLYSKYPATLLAALGLSLGVHTLAVLAAVCIGQAIGIRNLDILPYFVYCPIINAIASIPISIGGVGLREGAYQYFFQLSHVEIQYSTALSIISWCGIILMGLVCGIIYLTTKPTSWKSSEAISHKMEDDLSRMSG